MMKTYIAILLLLATSASAQITAKYQHSDQTVKIYSQAGHVWLYVIDGVDVVAGCEQFNELAKGRLVDWERAAAQTMKQMRACNGNGKGCVKVTTKSGAVLEYDDIAEDVLMDLLKSGCLVEADESGNGNGNGLRKEK